MVGANTMAIDDTILILLTSGVALEWDGAIFRAQISDVWIKIDDDHPAVDIQADTELIAA
jgi:hypothetical protein